jgi:hypothetical protein
MDDARGHRRPMIALNVAGPKRAKALAEHGATTRQLMEVLGHDNMEHAELYSREAEQKLMAVAAMEKLLNWRRPKDG